MEDMECNVQSFVFESVHVQVTFWVKLSEQLILPFVRLTLKCFQQCLEMGYTPFIVTPVGTDHYAHTWALVLIRWQGIQRT